MTPPLTLLTVDTRNPRAVAAVSRHWTVSPPLAPEVW